MGGGAGTGAFCPGLHITRGPSYIIKRNWNTLIEQSTWYNYIRKVFSTLLCCSHSISEGLIFKIFLYLENSYIINTVITAEMISKFILRGLILKIFKLSERYKIKWKVADITMKLNLKELNFQKFPVIRKIWH